MFPNLYAFGVLESEVSTHGAVKYSVGGDHVDGVCSLTCIVFVVLRGLGSDGGCADALDCNDTCSGNYVGNLSVGSRLNYVSVGGLRKSRSCESLTHLNGERSL